MAHGLTNRDIQSGLENAWHRLTNIVPEVTKENSTPFEVVSTPLCYRIPSNDPFGEVPDKIIEDPNWRRLIATDDFLPVGDPFAPSYTPSSIAGFWNILEKGLGETPYTVISAGTTDNRGKVFASIKVTDGFRVGDRIVKDYITLLDSFDKSCSITAVYSSIVTVCLNTFLANLQAGSVVGKARHSGNLDGNIQKVIDALDTFAGTSAYFQHLMETSDKEPCSRDEARAWVTGVETRNAKDLSNSIKQRTARIVELFDGGKGNSGRTRLDAAMGITEFYSHESSREAGNQLYSSEFGSGAQVKRFVMEGFERDWDKFVKAGEAMLAS
jgi:hypothetical protein